MKKLIVLLSIFVLASCGMSEVDKEEIAIITCNIMSESRNMDAAMRIKEINSAREKIGEERFLLTDESIKESFKYFLCKDLVLNDEFYYENLEAAKKRWAEAEIVMKEAERQAEKEKAILEQEEQRIGQKLREGALKLEQEKQEAALKKENEERRVALKTAIKKYNQNILSQIEGYTPEVKRAWWNKNGLLITINCKQLLGLNYEMEVKFNNGDTLQNLDNGVRYCGESGVPQIPEPWTRNFLFRIPSEMSDLTKSFDVRRSGDVEKHIVEFKLKIKMGEMSSYKDFPPMRFEDSYLEEPIVLKWVNNKAQ
jgi:hypothetical protein